MLAELLDLQVDAVASALPLQPGRSTPCIAADFNHPTGELAVLLLADLAFATRSGAALTRLPLDRAEQALGRGSLDDILLENYREVVNVLTALYRPYECRLVLGEVSVDLPALSFEKKMFIRKPPGRLDCELRLDSYGVGRVALLRAG
jgi:hypothetical protein